jgi:hypothetical protein
MTAGWMTGLLMVVRTTMFCSAAGETCVNGVMRTAAGSNADFLNGGGGIIIITGTGDIVTGGDETDQIVLGTTLQPLVKRRSRLQRYR